MAMNELTKDEIVFAEDDSLIFLSEDTGEGELSTGKWKVIIVDDEKEVHNITKLVLNDFVFDGKTLEFISAYSGEEAKRVVAENPDVAVILMDVVMEEDDSGLKVIEYIREVLKNSLVRIILRTGQPGQAPEKRVIMDFDINDYKEKTELTSQKLFTVMVASLRSYRDILIIDSSKKGLEKIIESSASIFEIQSMKKFASGVLTQLTSILNLNKNAIYCQTSSFAATKNDGEYYILAATGDYSECIGNNIKEIVTADVLSKLEMAHREKKSIFFDNHFIVYFKTDVGTESMIYLEGFKDLNDLDKYLVEIFCTNVSIAFDNLNLNKEIENTQREIVYTLGEVAEARSKETGHHVKRVAEYSRILAQKYGLPDDECEIIRLASPIHDIGKLGVPDNILNKPGKLTVEEFEIIKKHSTLGYEMLKSSNKEIMRTAAIIAHQHHEKFDGSGYPCGLKGKEIHIYGRIAAIADVLDALGSERVYKKAWELDRILELFKEESGKHFDPNLIDIFFENLDEFIKIKNTFVD
jgi:response regulator RpfG family c-di-GMP phosphodiesterase